MGKVHLISGGGKIYADIAARFCRSEDDVQTIIGKPYSEKIVKNLLESGHLSALEFDYFLFGVEGFSRVCETQLVRKRHASYMIKSGREELHGKRKFDVYLPDSVKNFHVSYTGKLENPQYDMYGEECDYATVTLTAADILEIIEEWYDIGVKMGKPEEDLRYLKPQGTTFRGIIGMNAHALHDFFGQRMCMRAQAELRSMATQMYELVSAVAPDLFANAGPKCFKLGYCPENEKQHLKCKAKGLILTHDKVMDIVNEYRTK